jgi:glycosyltransferase involved in cell wall biosynthesis
MMRCLWLTLADPDPLINGQLIYTGGFLAAAVAAGASLHVIGLDRHGEKEGPPQAHANLRWQLHRREIHSVWRRILSPMPPAALYGFSRAARRAVDQALADQSWDAVVFDSLMSAWALPTVLRRRLGSGRPPLVYVAHNCEATAARRIADASHGARRLLKLLDWAKVASLERRLLAQADFVTANVPEDCEALAPATKAGKVAFLPPGYDGPRVACRAITADTPRRAVIIGSFDWSAKRQSLERFLDAGANRLAAAGVELQVVGSAEPRYLAGLRRRFPQVTFVGPVADVRPYLASARIGLVPDVLGGFKLKALDYVFNRLPIMAMRGGLSGMPLEDGVSFGLFDTPVGLAEGVVSLIDSFAELNARQERAFAACADGFDWPQLGRRLMSGIEAAVRRKPVKSAVRTRPVLPPPDVAALRRSTCAAHFNMARVPRPPSEPPRLAESASELEAEAKH